jgi:putative ABC transport system substrate-binding protein
MIVRRREFITLLGGAAAAWPLAARAQQSALPVVGYIGSTAEMDAPRLRAFRQGLDEAGYVEGRNVAVDYRGTGNIGGRGAELAAELVRRQVSVIVGVAPSAAGAKAATSTIPIVFWGSPDPVQVGLVASLNRPGGNVTGVSLLGYELDAKRLELLRELIPHALTIGVLVNTKSPTGPSLPDIKAAAEVNGQRLVILDAGTETELEAAFASLKSQGLDALLVTTNPFYEGRRERIVALAERHSMPAVYSWREYSAVGGLISYGTSFTESYRQAGLYVGRILKGEKPADLPVVQATKFELIINLKTAKALGLTVPQSTLLRADEVIE